MVIAVAGVQIWWLTIEFRFSHEQATPGFKGSQGIQLFGDNIFSDKLNRWFRVAIQGGGRQNKVVHEQKLFTPEEDS